MKVNSYSESNHWYDQYGNPVYEIPMKTDPNRFRATTIKDAVELGLYPSVTTILGILRKPGLENWKVQQAMIAAAEIKREDGEPDQLYFERVRAHANQVSKEAKENGTIIHDVIERYLRHKYLEDQLELFSSFQKDYLKVFKEFWDKTSLIPEGLEVCVVKQMVPVGYAGKCDFIGRSGKTNRKVIIDWKTQSFKDGKSTIYPEWGCQLAAYARATVTSDEQLDDIDLVSVVIDTTKPGLIKYHKWENNIDLWKQFLFCYHIWLSPLGTNFSKRRKVFLQKKAA